MHSIHQKEMLQRNNEKTTKNLALKSDLTTEYCEYFDIVARFG